MIKERTNYIDIAKGIAIILVVYAHASAQLKGTSFYEEHLYFQNWIIFSFVMPIFFIISGAFQRKRLESLDFDHRNYLIKILQSILLPYYSLSIIFLLINLSVQKIIDTPSLSDMLFALLLQQSNKYLLPSGVLWFLFTLFSFSLITYVSFKIIKISPIFFLIFTIILRTDLNIYYHSWWLSFNKISEFFIFYMFGYCFNKLITQSPIYKFKNLFFILSGNILLISFSLKGNNYAIAEILRTISPLGIIEILGSLFVIGVSFNLSMKFNKNILIKIISYFGIYSILVYVFHMPTFTIFNKIAVSINLDPNYTKQLILFLPGILLPLVYGKLLAYNKLIYKVLLGRNP